MSSMGLPQMFYTVALTFGSLTVIARIAYYFFGLIPEQRLRERRLNILDNPDDESKRLIPGLK